MAKKTIVIERKLGRHQADGVYWESLKKNEDNLIELDPRLKSKDYLETAIHEKFHDMFKDMSEKDVLKFSKQLCKFVWNLGYRRIHLK